VTPARRALTRRALLRGAGAALAVLSAAPARAAGPARPAITVYKSPT
jgi:hypothetical protein